MVLDTTLFNTQQYKVRIKGKVVRCKERSSALPYISVVAIEKGAFWSPSIKGRQLYFYFILLSSSSQSDNTVFLAIIAAIHPNHQALPVRLLDSI